MREIHLFVYCCYGSRQFLCILYIATTMCFHCTDFDTFPTLLFWRRQRERDSESKTSREQ